MSENDFQIIRNPGAIIEFDVNDRDGSGFSATIKAGEAVGRYGASGSAVTNANYVLPIFNNAPEISSDIFVGIATEVSNETATVDGKCLVALALPGLTVIRGKANTSTNVNTAAKLLGIMMDFVAFDKAGQNLTAGATTIDEDETDDSNVHGLCIVGGDIDKFTLDVIIHAAASIVSPLTGQTMD